MAAWLAAAEASGPRLLPCIMRAQGKQPLQQQHLQGLWLPEGPALHEPTYPAQAVLSCHCSREHLSSALAVGKTAVDFLKIRGLEIERY